MKCPARLFLLALLVMLWAVAGAALSKEDAVSSAQSWVALVDAGKYADSWTQASAFFQSHVPQQSWEQQVKVAREPFGEMVSRKVAQVTLKRTLPGAPDGEYAVMVFNSSFRHKAAAAETITVMAENGKWKVAGYFIR